MENVSAFCLEVDERPDFLQIFRDSLGATSENKPKIKYHIRVEQMSFEDINSIFENNLSDELQIMKNKNEELNENLKVSIHKCEENFHHLAKIKKENEKLTEELKIQKEENEELKRTLKSRDESLKETTREFQECK